jgi:hypothetical protein
LSFSFLGVVTLVNKQTKPNKKGNMKIIPVKLTVLGLIIMGAIAYAYADCHYTDSYGCGADSYDTGSCLNYDHPPLRNWVNEFTSSPDMDHCDSDTLEGVQGNVDCSNEATIQCTLTLTETDCQGNKTVTNFGPSPTTPTQASGASC